MAPTQYTVLGEHAAEVDDIRLEPGGAAVELTEDQVRRLNDTGVQVEQVAGDGEPKAHADLKKAEAVARAEAAGLDTSGTLPELVERLEAHDAQTTTTDGDDR